MLRKEIENFFIQKKGYLKKSPFKVASAIWNGSNKLLPKSQKEVEKDLDLIRVVQRNLRAASMIRAATDNEFLLNTYMQIVEKKNKPKRKLFFDIEVSPNVVLSWNVGYDLDIPHDNILQERAIICICYKWEGEDKISSLQWNNGDDRDMLLKFAKVIDSADEVVTQNGDAFDIKWLRTRCLHHRIPVSPKFNSIDTLKLAKSAFRFNSNKLDYMGKFLGIGGKIKTDPDMWKNILVHNDKRALTDMVTYCKMDVQRLEEVYKELQSYVPPKKFKYKF